MPWQAQALTLSIATLAATLALGWGEYRGPRALVYAAKPLATLLILALAVAAPPGADPRVARWILAGLVFSLAGDVLLMLPSDRFAAGLTSFLVAHVCYIAAFTREMGFGFSPAALLPLLLAGALMLRLLAPGLGALRVPVIVYTSVLIAMAWQAVERSLALPDSGPVLAAVGACLFVASDSTLALARFHRPFASSHGIVYATYFAAQWLIALSLHPAAGVT